MRSMVSRVQKRTEGMLEESLHKRMMVQQKRQRDTG